MDRCEGEGWDMDIHTTYLPPRTRNGRPTMRAGDRVRIVTPWNPRLHNTEARIETLAEWGAHLAAPAAASGAYRAAWHEMEPVKVAGGTTGVEYSGDICDNCGGMRLRWAGACKVCDDCGTSGGCG